MLLVLFLNSLCFAAQTLPPPITGKVIEVNSAYNFVVVNLGENDGLKPGSFLKVLRQDKELGKLEVIKVRQTIAAAEIREIRKGEQIKTDDAVILLSEQKIVPLTQPQKTKEAKEKRQVVSSQQLAKTVGANIKIEGDKNIVEADIKANPSLVFDAANILLRDRGFIVAVANREASLLVASKGLILSRWEELWAGFTGAIDYELLFSIQIKEKSNLSYIAISISTGYLKKDRYYKRIIKDNSYVYKEALDLISEVKNWTEGILGAKGPGEKKTP